MKVYWHTINNSSDCLKYLGARIEKECTVKELIEEIMENAPEINSGFIAIKTDNSEDIYSYKNKKVLEEIPNKILEKVVIKADAIDKWVTVNYSIWIE